jgi:rfaE bifunctional protein kinase chain/domain
MKRLKALMERFDAGVAVAGDWMLDEYLWGTVNRISPEAPVPVVEFARQTWTLGGAGNVAANIKALGGRPVPFGVVGDDEAGRRVLDALAELLGWRPDSVLVDQSRPTTWKRRVMAHHQQLLRIDSESRAPLAAELRERLAAEMGKAMGQVRAVVVSDYGKGAMTRSLFEKILELALASGVPVALDPKEFDLEGVGPVTVITPNEREAEKFSGVRIRGQEGVEEAGRTLLEKTGALNILITRGEHGMSLFTHGEAPVHMPAQAREVYDVTGAGDTVAAVIGLSLAAGASVREAAELANVAAGIVVGKLGTATVSPQELRSALDGVWPRGGGRKQRDP